MSKAFLKSKKMAPTMSPLSICFNHLLIKIIRAVLHECFLRKHAYSNILTILPPKNENFQIKSSDIFHMSAQNIDCGYSLKPPYRGGSNKYPQSMM